MNVKNLLESAQTIAVVGCSARPERTSRKIARYLQDAGYRIVPVNPNYEEILDEVCYPRVQDVPEDVALDIVDVFRAPQYTAAMVRDVIARTEATGERPTVWTQIGVSSPEAQALAEEAELPYVKNRCLMMEHGRVS